ncbi:MAG TPA: dTMP kinase [Candidatus Hydrogenedentes bacterium]|jgi:dTMP kinase|nr:dTMP kinase [Candidatus Hydrogenedentota bacterium]
MKGAFITFEGCEGSGKSTQIRLMADFLRARGAEVTITREPGGTPLAERIRGLLMETCEETIAPLTELFLYEAARAQHVQQVVLPALQRGAIVLCDRFYDSTTVYQGVGRKLDSVTVGHLNRLAAGAARPMHTYVFDLPAAEGLRRARERGSDDRMMQEAVTFHEAVREGFLALAQEEGDRITIVDASRPIEIIQEELRRHICALPFMENR